MSPFAHRYALMMGAIAVVAPFLAPLLVFTPRLLSEWRRGVFEYGALSHRLARDLERRWFQADPGQGRGLASRISRRWPTCTQITANVRAMRFVPVDLKSLVLLIGAVLLPAAPVMLLSLPVGTIARALARVFV